MESRLPKRRRVLREPIPKDPFDFTGRESEVDSDSEISEDASLPDSDLDSDIEIGLGEEVAFSRLHSLVF